MRIHYQRLSIQSFEPGILFDAVADAGFEHRLLSGGTFEGQLDRVYLPNCQIDRGCYSLPCFARGVFSKDWIVIGTTYCKRRAVWINGHDAEYGNFQLYAEESELNYRTGVGAPWYALQLRRDWLQSVAVSLTGRELPFPERGWCNRGVGASNLDAYCTDVDAIIALEQQESPERLSEAASLIEMHLMKRVIHALSRSNPDQVVQQKAAERRQQFIRCIEMFLSEHQNGPFQVQHLLACTAMKERTLQRLCKEAYGLTPVQLFGVARLNQIRRELLMSQNRTATIQAVAHKWGVRHLGRFSAQYHNLFGEHPHDTLSRHG